MPYIRRRRPECKMGVVRPGVAGERGIALPAPVRRQTPEPGRARPPAPHTRTTRSPSCARSSPRSGIPGSGGTDHRRRAHRRARRIGPRPRRQPRDLEGRTSSASWSTFRRRASSSRRRCGRWSGVAVLALRPSVRAGGYVGTIDLLVVDPSHDVDRVTGAAPRGAASVGPQQGLRRRRDAGAGGRRRADRLGPPRLRAGRAAHRTSNHGGPGARRTGVRSGARGMRDRQAGGRTIRPPRQQQLRSHSGQERRRLRGRGEHLLRGQGGGRRTSTTSCC